MACSVEGISQRQIPHAFEWRCHLWRDRALLVGSQYHRQSCECQQWIQSALPLQIKWNSGHLQVKFSASSFGRDDAYSVNPQQQLPNCVVEQSHPAAFQSSSTRSVPESSGWCPTHAPDAEFANGARMELNFDSTEFINLPYNYSVVMCASRVQADATIVKAFLQVPERRYWNARRRSYRDQQGTHLDDRYGHWAERDQC
jgi:hypothetical protein